MSIKEGGKGRDGLKIVLQQESDLTRSYQNKKWPAMSYTDELQNNMSYNELQKATMTHPAMIERGDLKNNVRVVAMSKNEDKK